MKILAFAALGDWKSLDSEPAESLPLVKRVREVALATGAEVHFTHQVFDTALDTSGASGANGAGSLADKLRDEMLRDERRYLDPVLHSFREQGIPVTSSVQFVRSTIGSLLEEIETVAPDMVFKVSRDHNFVLGLFSNLDWDLIRQSPVPVWFVKKELPPLKAIVSAIDFVSQEAEGAGDAVDLGVLKNADLLASQLDAEHTVVHAYDGEGTGYPAPTGVAADLTFAASPETAKLLYESRRAHAEKVKQRHMAGLEALTTALNVKAENILLQEGPASSVISALAERVDAGLIVMGARSMERWERLLSAQHAEPVLSDSDSDVLFVPQAS